MGLGTRSLELRTRSFEIPMGCPDTSEIPKGEEWTGDALQGCVILGLLCIDSRRGLGLFRSGVGLF